MTFLRALQLYLFSAFERFVNGTAGALLNLMTHLTATKMMMSTLSKTGGAFLLLSLGAGCGVSTDGSISPVGGNNKADSGSQKDGGNGNPDSGNAGDSGNLADADSGNPKDSGGYPLAMPVNLGGAGNFVILAKSGISTVPTSAITGNIGVSPAAATYITGFSLTADSTNVFSTSPQITGKVYAADYASPTPSNLTTAVSDMETAFTDAAGRAPDVTELGAGNIGGMTLIAGVYKWGTGVLIPSNITLSGNSKAVWIFQIAQDLTMSSATNVFLSGGAVPKNIFWQVSGAVELGTTAHFEGIILTQTAVAMRTGASINGRLLAQTAVNIDASVVSAP